MYHDALVKLEQVIKHCELQKLSEYQVACLLLKLQIQFKLKNNINEALALLKSIEQENSAIRNKHEVKSLFWETKTLAYQTIHQLLSSDTSISFKT